MQYHSAWQIYPSLLDALKNSIPENVKQVTLLSCPNGNLTYHWHLHIRIVDFRDEEPFNTAMAAIESLHKMSRDDLIFQHVYELQ